MSLNDCYCHLGLTFSQNDLLKKVGGRGRGWGVTLLDSIGVASDRKQKLESEHRASVCPALPPPTSRRQQWAGGADRRLPLSDSNLWSISIIGGVCRDSYSNNYLDQTVSKATTPPPTTQRTNSERLCLPARLVIEKESVTLSFEPSFVKNRLVKITESCSYSAVIPLKTNNAAASVFIKEEYLSVLSVILEG